MSLNPLVAKAQGFEQMSLHERGGSCRSSMEDIVRNNLERLEVVRKFIEEGPCVEEVSEYKGKLNLLVAKVHGRYRQ